jgi:2,3-bisphosphoglycerate-independent phosphoglycerate mutase
MTGRYYAMDRDTHWERNEFAWNALVHGQGEHVGDPEQALAAAYAAGETDEFLKPRILQDAHGNAHVIADRDVVFFFNFRADRARQLSRLFVDASFAEFNRGKCPALAGFAAFTHYDNSLPIPAAFEKPNLDHCMGEVISNMGLRQLRIAETEKYAHVTYFYNCGREDPFANEDRLLIPSPRDVATYDQKPRMSAAEVTDALLRAWEDGGYAFIVCNLANPDMVGHTGILPAAIEACETVDACTARILEAVRRKKGRLVLTADHGNVEEMLTPDGKPHTAHTTNKVALAVLDDGPVKKLKKGGKLGDVAPTILHLWGVSPPEEMTGVSLWEGG